MLQTDKMLTLSLENILMHLLLHTFNSKWESLLSLILFFKWCCHSMRWKTGLFCKQHPMKCSRWTCCCPCHSRLQSRSFTTLHVKTFSIQSVLPSWQWKQILGWPEGRDHVPFPDLQKRLFFFFSHASFSRADIGRCKIMCTVSALRLWTRSLFPLLK